jgi:hypothetical protein
VADIAPQELRSLSAVSEQRVICPFKPDNAMCHKKGGVCSLALYELAQEEPARIVSKPVTTCPTRFLEANRAFEWVSNTLLGAPDAKVVSEVSFLMSEQGEEMEEDEVGRIDNVLVKVTDTSLAWCALEMQAVYFSGGKMEDDFARMRNWEGPGLPFPAKQRRPDYRSSGPKRLMPQLQIKVPTLRRWGKKMAVIVDKGFWESLGEIRPVSHLSNADIAWFIVDYEGPVDGRYRLIPLEAVFTTLEHSVEGLTGGTPVPLEQFETSIRQKLARLEAT